MLPKGTFKTPLTPLRYDPEKAGDLQVSCSQEGAIVVLSDTEVPGFWSNILSTTLQLFLRMKFNSSSFYQALPIHHGCHLPWIHQAFVLTVCSARPRNHCCSSIMFNNPDKEAKFIPLGWCRKVIHKEIKWEKSLWLEATANLWEHLPTYLRCCLGTFI